MADVVAPKHHLLRKAASRIIDDEKGRWRGRKHGGNFSQMH
jgi:hypothetical protein